MSANTKVARGIRRTMTALRRVARKTGPDQTAAFADHTDLRIWVQDLVNENRAYADTVFTGTATAQQEDARD